jgi:hypothetical protein
VIRGSYKVGTGKMPMEASLIDFFIILFKFNGVTISYSSLYVSSNGVKSSSKKHTQFIHVSNHKVFLKTLFQYNMSISFFEL